MLFITTLLSRHFVDICCQPRPWVGHFELNTRIQTVERLFTVNKRMHNNHTVSDTTTRQVVGSSSWFLEIFICFMWFCFSAFINLNVDHLIWVYMLEYRSLQSKSGTLMSRNGSITVGPSGGLPQRSVCDLVFSHLVSEFQTRLQASHLTCWAVGQRDGLRTPPSSSWDGAGMSGHKTLIMQTDWTLTFSECLKVL